VIYGKSATDEEQSGSARSPFSLATCPPVTDCGLTSRPPPSSATRWSPPSATTTAANDSHL